MCRPTLPGVHRHMKGDEPFAPGDLPRAGKYHLVQGEATGHLPIGATVSNAIGLEAGAIGASGPPSAPYAQRVLRCAGIKRSR